jgi:nucleotide-binding universal stress UspA family protein
VVFARLRAPAKPALLDAAEQHRQAHAGGEEHDGDELRVLREHDFSLAKANLEGIGNCPCRRSVLRPRPAVPRRRKIESEATKGGEMSAVIVVGVDGSEGAVRALEFALDEARARHTDVRAVAAWRVPASAYETGWVPVSVDPSDYEKIARAGLEKSLEEAAVAESDVSVTPILREGQAAEVLVAEARGADLLVVGSRGLGGFKGLLLGSVGQQCAHHATCPVAIVPNGNRPD